MRIDTVLFDFYGTLVRPAGPPRTLRELLAEIGVDLSDEVAADWHIDQLDGTEHIDASASRSAYEAWEDVRWTALLRRAGVDGPPEVERIIGDLRAAIRAFAVEAFTETIPVLTALRQRGLRVGVCSNWHWDLDPYLDAVGVTHLLDVAISSAHAGARKPHPRIYAHTLTAMDADPTRTLFVGDSWEPDVTGPIAAGMRSVHIHRAEASAPTLPDAASRGATLDAVLERIDQVQGPSV